METFEQKKLDNALMDGFTSSELGDSHDDVISFCKLLLQQNHPQGDNHKLLEIILSVFKGKSSHGKRFRAPGPMCQARWMAKAINSVIIW